MRTKIAPTLQQTAAECIEHIYGPEVGVEARRELSALLAVARAAKRMERLAYDGDWQAACEPLFRALDRLAKRAR